MLLGPCRRCNSESFLTKMDDKDYPICQICFDRYYSTKVKRENTIDRLLIDRKWWQFWK